jgi:hypothetical protein
LLTHPIHSPWHTGMYRIASTITVPLVFIVHHTVCAMQCRIHIPVILTNEDTNKRSTHPTLTQSHTFGHSNAVVVVVNGRTRVPKWSTSAPEWYSTGHVFAPTLHVLVTMGNWSPNRTSGITTISNCAVRIRHLPNPLGHVSK